jgi:hypothetical protein
MSCSNAEKKTRVIPFPVSVYGKPEKKNAEPEFEHRDLQFDPKLSGKVLYPPGRYKIFFIWDYL